MDAKEQAKDLWTKIRQCGRARLEELTPLDMLSLAINPPRKDKLLDEEEEYAVAIISSALSAQAAEVERMREGLMDARAQIESFGMSHRSAGNEAEYDRSLRCLFCIDALMGNP